MDYIFIVPQAGPEELELWLEKMDSERWLENEQFVLMAPDDPASARQVKVLTDGLDPKVKLLYPAKLGRKVDKQTEALLLDFVWDHSSPNKITVVFINNPALAISLAKRILAEKLQNSRPGFFSYAKPGQSYLVDCLRHRLADVI